MLYYVGMPYLPPLALYSIEALVDCDVILCFLLHLYIQAHGLVIHYNVRVGHWHRGATHPHIVLNWLMLWQK